jgi:hypothetical protein
MNLLVIDVGGTHVKVLLSGEREPRKFETGPKLTARKMVTGVALEPDEVVLGGGNAKELKELPPKCRVGDNSNAFRGGFRL